MLTQQQQAALRAQAGCWQHGPPHQCPFDAGLSLHTAGTEACEQASPVGNSQQVEDHPLPTALSACHQCWAYPLEPSHLKTLIR